MKKKSIVAFALLALAVMPVKAQYRVDRLITAGRSALFYEDYVLSIKYFNLAIGAKPYLYEPWYYRSVAKFNLDDFTGAEGDATEALQLNPYINDIYDLRAICRIRQNKYDDAISDYNNAIRLEPRNRNYWFNRALCYMQGKKYDDAIMQLDSIITQWKDYSNAYSLKAEVYLEKKDTTNAEKWLDKSLQLNPYDGDAWTTRAYMALARKEWKVADEALTKSLHFKPNNVNSYINRALARINLNNLRGAMSDYDNAIDLDPNNFLAHYNRGLMRVQLGDDNRAISDFDFVIKMEPQNFMAIFNRALLHEKTGNLRAAIRDFTTVINQFPNFWTGLSYRANCYRRLGMTAKAEQDEFRIFKAQMNKHLGIQPRWSAKTKKDVRKRSEIDPNKFASLVVDDEPKYEHEYKSEYRGRVQNRMVETALLPMYRVSYFPTTQSITTVQSFDKDVEAINQHTNSKEEKLYIVCNKEQLEEDKSLKIFALIDKLSAELSVAKDENSKKNLLIHRAIAHAVLRDFEAAIADFSDYIALDDTNAMAYWQRAVCQVEMNEFVSSEGQPILNLHSPEADFSDAIRLSHNNNAYIYYNRGNLHASHKELSKAIDDYNMALKIDSRMAEAYYNRGLVRSKMGNKNAAIQDLSKAGELGLYDAYSVIKRLNKQK